MPYSEHVEEMVLTVSRKEIADGEDVELAMELQAQGDGFVMQVRVVELTDSQVRLDGNRLLAGKSLIFTFQLLSIG